MQEVDVLDIHALVTSISSSINTSQNTLDEAMQLKLEAESSWQYLVSLKEDLDRTEEAVENGSSLVAETEQLLQETNSSIQSLQEALSNLDTLEYSELQQVLQDLSSQLSSLESELSMTDISTLYNILSDSLQGEKDTRDELEKAVAVIEEEVENLRHLESMLPQGCDSNL